jgi:hypothetical protein
MVMGVSPVQDYLLCHYVHRRSRGDSRWEEDKENGHESVHERHGPRHVRNGYIRDIGFEYENVGGAAERPPWKPDAHTPDLCAMRSKR